MSGAGNWRAAWGGVVGILLAAAAGYGLALALVAARCASLADVVRVRCWR